MSGKNSNLWGIMAILTVLLLVFALLRRRLRLGFWLMTLLITALEKWSESREMRRIHSILDQVS